MQALRNIKNRVYFFSIWRRLHALWNDYKSLADDGHNFRAAESKLHEFLDSFQKYYEELVQGGYLDKESLDRIYGDLGTILLEILDKVERESADEKNKDMKVVTQFINKALNVAELILHDDKYIVIVKETPNLLHRILSLLDSMKTVENKRIVLRLISNLSKDFDNKMEIGRLEGFRKILLLLVEKDSELTTEIVKTIKQFLDEINIPTEYVEDAKQVVEVVTKPSLSVYAQTKVRSIITEVSKVLTKFTRKVDNEVLLAEDVSESEEMEHKNFIPSNDQIQRSFNEKAALKASLASISTSAQISPITTPVTSSSTIPATSIGSTENKCESAIDSVATTSATSSPTNDNKEKQILKELMRVQGALSTLTETLQEAAMTVQLDLLETISKLLFKSQKNQEEFRKINGYFFMVRLFDTLPKLSQEESNAFLEQSFKLLFPICLDGNADKRVGNSDALLLLLRIVSDCSHVDVRLYALRTVQDIISVNPLNVVDIFDCNGVDLLVNVVIEESKNENSDGSFVGSVLALLQYIAVISSKHNIIVLEKLLELTEISEFLNFRSSVVQCALLQAIAQMTQDYVYRGNAHVLGPKVVKIILQIINLLHNYEEFLKKNSQESTNENKKTEDEPKLSTQNLQPQRQQEVFVDEKAPKRHDEIFDMELDVTDNNNTNNNNDDTNKDDNNTSGNDLVNETITPTVAKSTTTTTKTTPTTTATTTKITAIPIAATNDILSSLLLTLGILLHRSAEFFPSILGENPSENSKNNSQEADRKSINLRDKIATKNCRDLSEILFPLMNLVYLSDSNPSIGISPEIPELSLWILNDVIVSDTRFNKQPSTMLGWMINQLKFDNVWFPCSCFYSPYFRSSASSNFPSVPSLAQEKQQSSQTKAKLPSISTSLKEKMCCSISRLIQELRSSTVVNNSLMVQSALVQLVQIIQNKEVPELSRAAWYTFGEIIRDNESLKMFVGRSIGYENLAQIIVSAGVLVDRDDFDVVLELACHGGNIFSSEEIFPFPTVNDTVQKINTPQPLFTRLYEHSSREPKQDSSRTHPTTTDSYSSDDESMPPQESFRRNLSFENLLYNRIIPVQQPNFRYITTSLSTSRNSQEFSGNGLSSLSTIPSTTTTSNTTTTISSTTSLTSSPIISKNTSPKKATISTPTISTINITTTTPTNTSPIAASSRRKRRKSSHKQSTSPPTLSTSPTSLLNFPLRKIAEFLEETAANTVEKNEERLSASSSYTRLAKVVFREPQVTPLLLIVLPTCPVVLQKDILKLILALCESNETNKLMLSAGSALRHIIQILKKGHLPEISIYYYQLLAVVGMYDITPEEVKLLYDLASIREKQKDQQQSQQKKMILYILATFAERHVPPSFFSFSGLSGHFRFGMLDKFPPAKTGYTMSCWLKLNAFLRPEQGLLSWNNHQTNDPIFEMYFKTYISTGNNENKPHTCLLSVQTHSPPSPPENFSFDNYNFSEWGEWHHVVFSHCKQEVILYVDGKLVQSYSNLNYPKNVAKDVAITGYIGRRGSSKASHFCGQIGTIYFQSGVMDLETVKKIYSKGSLWNPPNLEGTSETSFFGNTLENFLTLNPSAYLLSEANRYSSSTSITISGNAAPVPRVPSSSTNLSVEVAAGNSASTSSTSNSPITATSATATSAPSTNSVESQNNPLMGSIQDTVYPPGVVAHHTHVLQSRISEVQGGLLRTLHFFDMHPQSLAATLRIIVGLLWKSPENLLEFQKFDGFSLLTQILRKKSSYFTTELFDVLIDICCETHEVTKQCAKWDSTQNGIKFVYHHVIVLIFRLLLECCANGSAQTEEVVKHVLRTIHALLLQNPENITFLLSSSSSSLSLSSSISPTNSSSLTIPSSSSSPSIPPIEEVGAGSNSSNTNNNNSDNSNNTDTNSSENSSVSTSIPSSTSTSSSKEEKGNEKDVSKTVFWQILEIFERMARANFGLQGLQKLLQVLLPHIQIHHLEALLNFILGSSPEDFLHGTASNISTSTIEERHASMRAIIVQEIYSLMTKKAAFTEQLRNFRGEFGGFHVVLTLLKSPSETIRILALKMIGVLIHRHKNSANFFLKNSGFEMISLLLAPFPVTLGVGRALLGIAMDEYRVEGMKDDGYFSFLFSPSSPSPAPTLSTSAPGANSGNSSSADNSVKKAEEPKNRLVHPVALHSLFELMKFADDENFKTAALVDVSERLLTSKDNLEIIWEECNWLDWCLSFLENSPSANSNSSTSLSLSNVTENNSSNIISSNNDEDDEEDDDEQEGHSHNTLRQLEIIIRKLMVHELEKKSSRIIKLKEVENEQFQGHVIEVTIDYYSKNPKLSRDTAPIIIPNLVSLFRHVKGLKILPRVYVRILDLIAKLTVHNSAEIRAMMNKEKLFAVRSELILYLLQVAQISPEATRHFVDNFDFQSIAAHTEFRDNFGIHYLLRFFHETKGTGAFQEKLFFILKRVIGGIEENKIILKELLDDDVIFKNFFAGKASDQEIITWYFAPERAPNISAVETKLKKVLIPLDSKFRSWYEKIRKRGKTQQRKSSTAKWAFATIEQKRKRDEKISRDFFLGVLEFSRKEKEEFTRISEEKWIILKEEEDRREQEEKEAEQKLQIQTLQGPLM